MLLVLPLAVLAYMLGALPFGVWIARRRGVDIQREGSGNTGATNVARVLGRAAGIATLLLDTAKGALPTYLALRWCGMPLVVAITAFAAVAGHCFSPFLAWKGGKGVATALGVFLVISPFAAVCGIVGFVGMWRTTKIVALGSLAGMAMICLVLVARGQPVYAQLGTALLTLLLYTHRDNLIKLALGG